MHPLSIQVPSVTTTVTGYMFPMGSSILVRRGPIGEYLVEHKNWRYQQDYQQRRRLGESDPNSGVAGGCGNISEVITVLSSTWPATG